MFEIGYDVLHEEELKRVWHEINMIESQMVGPETAGAAIVDGKVVKRGVGFFIKDTLSRTVLPVISSIGERTEGFGDKFNNYTVLVNYYGDGDYYGEHHDQATKTLTIVLCKDKDNVEGGEFVLTEENTILPCVDNSYILFDSHMKHKVNPVTLKDKNKKGRYSLTYFFF
jgi:hypothetical protein